VKAQESSGLESRAMSAENEDTVRRIAALARLSIDEEEVRALGADFARILAHFESLAALDVEGVEPTAGATDVADVLRKDRPRPSLPPDAVLANAPERVDDFYSVPKTVGGDA
jgi:aspartyl-tRNA(Asn)/glutamyl-tRNA(Gln) amidotransferase subunit C